MEERLDQLFKDKLANHKADPSGGAWEQINEQLANGRKKRWVNKFSIAATLLLLVSASFIGYKYMSGIEQNTPLVSSSENLETNEKSESQNIEPTEDVEQLAVAEEETESSPKNFIAKVDDVSSNTRRTEIKAEPIEEKTSSREEPLPEGNSQEDLTNVSEPPVLKESELLEESTEPEIDLNEKEPMEENVMLAEATPEPVKNYPKVQIVYKADANSALIASNNRNLINKGIEKITKFSDEHIVTEQVKTKLRNTKDDLLALNFGKLLNKSNKDLEN